MKFWLTGKYEMSDLPSGPRAALFRKLLPKIKDLRMAIEEIADRRNKTAAQVAINWCICKGTVPIPGVKNMKQTKENLGSLGWRLTESEIADLEQTAQRSSGKMIQNIFQTK